MFACIVCVAHRPDKGTKALLLTHATALFDVSRPFFTVIWIIAGLFWHTIALFGAYQLCFCICVILFIFVCLFLCLSICVSVCLFLPLSLSLSLSLSPRPRLRLYLVCDVRHGRLYLVYDVPQAVSAFASHAYQASSV